eukprot:6173241-Pleurochrysis_carterae.AAC.2
MPRKALVLKGAFKCRDGVFERLIAAGLTLKPSKCGLLRKDLKVLGYVVTRDGVKPNPEKVKAIARMAPKLSNQKEVLRFLGIINFNRRFIANLGEMAKPLYGLILKKGVSADAWPWNQRCRRTPTMS